MTPSSIPLPSDWYEKVVDAINFYQPRRQPEIVPDWREGKTGIRLEIPERDWEMVVLLHDDGCAVGYDLINSQNGDFIDGVLVPMVSAQADYAFIASAILAEIAREVQTRASHSMR